jgi:hypothetical protein
MPKEDWLADFAQGEAPGPRNQSRIPGQPTRTLAKGFVLKAQSLDGLAQWLALAPVATVLAPANRLHAASQGCRDTRSVGIPQGRHIRYRRACAHRVKIPLHFAYISLHVLSLYPKLMSQGCHQRVWATKAARINRTTSLPRHNRATRYPPQGPLTPP